MPPRSPRTCFLLLVAGILLGLAALIAFFYLGYRYLKADSGRLAVVLEDFTSRDRSFSLSLPRGWFRSEDGRAVRGDPDVILFAVRAGLGDSPTFSIARMRYPVDALQRVIEWAEERASSRILYEKKSLADYSTLRYSGKMLEFSVAPGETLCKEWLLLDHWTGYGLTMCALPELWKESRAALKIAPLILATALAFLAAACSRAEILPPPASTSTAVPPTACPQTLVPPVIREVRPAEPSAGEGITLIGSGGYLQDACGGLHCLSLQPGGCEINLPINAK